jgi:hypothetical protein
MVRMLRLSADHHKSTFDLRYYQIACMDVTTPPPPSTDRNWTANYNLVLVCENCQIYGRTKIQPGTKCKTQKEVYQLVEKCKSEQMNVDDDVHFGWPSTLTCTEDKKQIHQHIWDNRRMRNDETASEMSICHRKKQCKNSLRPKQKYLSLM